MVDPVFQKKKKAKVGKRAPKAHNDTDVTFTAAKLSVLQQQQQQTSSLDALSYQIQQHHSGHVKRSALQKLQQQMMQKQPNNDDTTTATIPFSTLLACAGSGLLESEDGAVRTAATQLFETILLLQQQQTNNSHNRSRILEYILAALNALNVRVALNGARLVPLMLERTALPQHQKQPLLLLLESLTRLLGMHNTRLVTNVSRTTNNNNNNNNANSKKRKRGEHLQHEKSVVVTAILSVLQQQQQQQTDESSCEETTNTTTTISSSLVFGKRQPLPRRLGQIRSLSQLRHYKSGANTTRSETSSITMELLTKLRDVLMESSKQDRETFVTSCRAIQCLLKQSSSSRDLCVPTKQLMKVCRQIAGTILENLFADHKNDNGNASLLLALLQLADVSSKNQPDVKNWVDAVANHLYECLEHGSDTTAKSNGSSSSLLDVLEHLFLHFSGLLDDDDSNQTVWSLTELFCGNFFDDKHLETTSEMGCRAVRLACLLLDQSDYDLKSAKVMFGPAVSDIITGLPRYLKLWQNNHVEDSRICIAAIRKIVCRVSGDGQEGSTATVVLLSSLRDGLEPLVVATAEYQPGSMLEQYPDDLQRELVCLITTLSPPSEVAIQNLAKICARSHTETANRTVSGDVASFIVQCVHRIRRTLSMQTYLSFVVDSSGLLHLNENCFKKDVGLFLRDRAQQSHGAVRDLCNCIVDCGPTKMLPKLEGVLRALLNSTASVIQIRATVATLAILSLDITMDGRVQASVLDCLTLGFADALTASICRLLSVFVSDKTALRDWHRPIIALLSAEPRVLVAIPRAIVAQWGLVELNEKVQLLEGFLFVLGDEQLRLARSRDSLLSEIDCLVSKANDGTEELYRLARRIRSVVELLAPAETETTQDLA